MVFFVARLSEEFQMKSSRNRSIDELPIELLWIEVLTASPSDGKLGISFVQVYPAISSVGCKHLRGSQCS